MPDGPLPASPLNSGEDVYKRQKSTAEPAAEEDVKGPAPKPAAALASALRALRRYESKAENPPSGLDRQVLEKISRTASRLLGRI